MPPFDPDAYIAKYIQPKPTRLAFKDSNVESEFGEVAPDLQELASSFSDPITVTSGKRSIDQNAQVGGVPNSFHTTGQAIDIRKDVPYETIASHFGPKGYEVINESDHYHIEPKKEAPTAPAPFDPDAYIKKYKLSETPPPELPPIAPPSSELAQEGARQKIAEQFVPKFDEMNDLEAIKHRRQTGDEVHVVRDAARGIRSFSKSATGGLSEVAANAIAAPIASTLKEGDPNLLEETKGLGNTYRQIKKLGRESLQKGEEESPISSTLGNFGGYIAPGAVFGKLYKGAKGLTAAPNMTAEAVPYLAKLMQAATTGGLANLGQQGIETVSDRLTGGGREFTPVKDFLTGAAFDGGGSVLGKGAGQTYKKLKQSIDTGVVPAKVRGAIESIPGVGGYFRGGREAEEKAAQNAYQEARDVFKTSEIAKKSKYDADVAELNEAFRSQEAARKGAYKAEQKIALDSVREVPRVDPIGAGTNLSKKAQEAELALSKQYSETVNPIIKKYNLRKISPDKVRKEIVEILKPEGLVDKKGNFIPAELDNIIAPERRKLMDRLININQILQSNPSVRKMNQVVQDLQSMANFNSPTRTAEDKVFGSLSRVAKESLLDGIESVAKGDDFQKIKQAREFFAKSKPTVDTILKATKKSPEKIVKSVSSQLPPSFVKEAIKYPGMKEPIADVVLNNIVQRGTSPKSLAKAIDEYGRDTLKELLSPDDFNKLLAAEKRLGNAAQPYARSIAPKPIPFKPGTPPKQPEEELAKIYKMASDFLANRQPGRITKSFEFKALAPVLSSER